MADLPRQGRRLVLVESGLNAAAAGQRTDAGLTLNEMRTSFSPTCDARLDTDSFGQLGPVLRLSQGCLHIVLATFVRSLCYNGLGLKRAVQGRFAPIVSATLLVRYADFCRRRYPCLAIPILFLLSAVGWLVAVLFPDGFPGAICSGQYVADDTPVGRILFNNRPE